MRLVPRRGERETAANCNSLCISGGLIYQTGQWEENANMARQQKSGRVCTRPKLDGKPMVYAPVKPSCVMVVCGNSFATHPTA